MADKQYYLVVTDLGKTLIDDAYNNSTKVNIIEMALGDSGGSYVKPDSSITQLVSEFGREDIHDDLGGNDGLIHVISKVTAKNAGQTVREFGLYDDLGNMIVYGAYPESLVPDAAEAEYIQLEIEAMVYLDNASAVTISVNPIYQYASELEAGIIKLIDELEVLEEDESNADDSKSLTLFKLLKRKATNNMRGLMRFATGTESVSETLNSAAVTPAQIFSQTPDRTKHLSTTDLNTLNSIDKCGFYYQTKNADTAGNNYPTAHAGCLVVTRTSTPDSVVQVYMRYNDAITFKRAYQGGSWTSWSSYYDTGPNKPTADDLAVISKFVKTVVGDDWNDLKDIGPYAVLGATGANKPSAYTYGTLFVTETPSTVVQTYNTDSVNQVLFRTYWKTNATWTQWETLGGVAHAPNSAQNLGGSDLNGLDGSNSYSYGEYGFFYQDATAQATPERNYPEKEPGSLLVQKSAMTGGYGCTQTYITRSGNIYTRSRYSSWSDWSRVYTTNNKPTPTELNALTGLTVSQNMRDNGKWILIAEVYLPHSSSTAKISVSGGAGFNGGTNYQSAEHRIIVRGGNKSGDANGSLYTDDWRGCPFDAFGWAYVGANYFKIYAHSRADYSLGCLFEYTASSGKIESLNETQSSEPSGITLGEFVKVFTDQQQPTLDEVDDFKHIGKAAVGTSVSGYDVSDSFMEFYDYGEDDFDMVSFDPSQYETHIYYDGYYLVDVEVVRDDTKPSGANGINTFVMRNEIQIMHGFVDIADTDKRNPVRMRRVIKLYGGDKIKVYSDKDGEWIEGGSILFQYLRPIATSKSNKAGEMSLVTP